MTASFLDVVWLSMIFQSGYDITRGKTKTLGPVLMMISSVKVGSPFIKRMFKK